MNFLDKYNFFSEVAKMYSRIIYLIPQYYRLINSFSIYSNENK